MQPISEELRKILAKRLKVSSYERPTYRVEVDRLVFIPGRVEEIQSLAEDYQLTKEVVRTWIDPSSTVSSYITTAEAVFPLPGRTLNDVTCAFGARGYNGHSGLDIAADVGETVVAAWGGKVKRIERWDYESYGHWVEILHEGGIITRYAHLSEIFVKVGDNVNQGQAIGKAGNTGNVWFSGHKVTGSYNDPNSERARGLGSHLHFEICLPNGKGDIYAVDPVPYLNGSKKLSLSSGNTGDGVTVGETYTGLPGEVRLDEQFVKRDWYTDPRYNLDANFQIYSSYDGEVQRFVFDPNTVSEDVTVGFNIEVDMQRAGFMDLSYMASLSEGDQLRVYENGNLVRRVTEFSGVEEELKGIAVPQGKNIIRIEVFWKRGSRLQTLALKHILIQELIVQALARGDKTIDNFDPTRDLPGSSVATGYWDVMTIDSFVFNEQPEKVSLQVGQFVYMDTLTLDNVQSIEIDSQFDMEAAEAQITISNPDGYYSPDYNPYLFPELYKDSPFSYWTNGGFHVGVLSENTPIRIYLGYGMNLMRVFTGLIDRVDMTADGNMTIYCRDRYKKIMDKVLTETKQYPREIDPANPLTNASWRDQIIAAAKKHAAAVGVDYKFLLAIAQQETAMGTQGWGRPEQGGYVLGYGCYSSSYADPAYAGIEKQMYFGAKRMVDALRSRGFQVDSWDDVEYFRLGGDLGTGYTWTSDENWTNNVWSIYNEIKANPSQWDTNYTESASGTDDSQKTAWLKSAVVQDLVAHAGMFGWRATDEDRQYPDAIIEETYLIEVDQKHGYVVKAGSSEGEFITVPISSIPTPQGWLNPFVEAYGKKFEAYRYKVSDCINEVIGDLNYRSYCDRYGTYRLEQLRLDKPVVAEFTENENLLTIAKTVDFSRARSHLVIIDADGRAENFIDKEILLELKGELRTAVISVGWAKSSEAKKQVALRAFFDMKRLCRTLQVSIVGNPALDILDRILVVDKHTTTRSVYTIKGIRTSFSKDTGYIQIIDLMWSAADGTVV